MSQKSSENAYRHLLQTYGGLSRGPVLSFAVFEQMEAQDFQILMKADL